MYDNFYLGFHDFKANIGGELGLMHCGLYDLWFFPIFSFKQTRGGSHHRSYKLDKVRVSLSPNCLFFNLVVGSIVFL